MITNSPIRSIRDGVVEMRASCPWVAGGFHRYMPIAHPATWATKAIAHSKYLRGPSNATLTTNRTAATRYPVEYGNDPGR
jgi:hypothetical protein